MTAKTPVSILNEYMSGMGKTPQYELVRDSRGHDTIFEYDVHVDRIKANGIGRSKKEAKHNAAKNALEMLMNTDDRARVQVLIASGIPSSRSQQILKSPENLTSVARSPYEEKVTENSVGMLAALCAEQKLPAPEYSDVDDTGPPHDKTFRVKCKVLSLSEDGVSRTKKQAKHLAAKQMINKINEQLNMPSSSILATSSISSPESPKKQENEKVVLQQYFSIKGKEKEGLRENVSLNLATSHLNFQKLEGQAVTALKESTNLLEDNLLQALAEELNVKLAFSFIDSKDEREIVCSASIITTPELVQFGSGRTRDAAQEAATLNLLIALKAFLC